MIQKLSVIAVAAVAITACAPTTTTVTSPAGPSPNVVATPGPGAGVPAGTTLQVRLLDRIAGREVEPGDRFAAEVLQPVVSTRGEVLLPQGARVYGHIAGLREGTRREPAAIGLSFDTIDYGGYRQPLAATVLDTQVSAQERDVKGTDVAIGAAIGAILGSLADFGEGTLIGAGVGAGAGTLVSMGRSLDDAMLPRGTVLTIRLDRPIEAYGAGYQYQQPYPYQQPPPPYEYREGY